MHNTYTGKYTYYLRTSDSLWGQHLNFRQQMSFMPPAVYCMCKHGMILLMHDSLFVMQRLWLKKYAGVEQLLMPQMLMLLQAPLIMSQVQSAAKH